MSRQPLHFYGEVFLFHFVKINLQEPTAFLFTIYTFAHGKELCKHARRHF